MFAVKVSVTFLEWQTPKIHIETPCNDIQHHHNKENKINPKDVWQTLLNTLNTIAFRLPIFSARTVLALASSIYVSASNLSDDIHH